MFISYLQQEEINTFVSNQEHNPQIRNKIKYMCAYIYIYIKLDTYT